MIYSIWVTVWSKYEQFVALVSMQLKDLLTENVKSASLDCLQPNSLPKSLTASNYQLSSPVRQNPAYMRLDRAATRTEITFLQYPSLQYRTSSPDFSRSLPLSKCILS